MFDLFSTSYYLQWAGSVTIAVTCLYHYSLRPVYIRVLGFYAVTSILFSIAQEISGLFFLNKGINAIGNGFVLGEALILNSLFLFLVKEKSFNKIIAGFLILYIAYYTVVLIFFKGNIYSLVRFGRDSLMIILALHYFYYLIRKLPEENLMRFPPFWINSAIILFFSGTFVLSLMVDYIVKVLGNDLSGFWAFRNFFRFFFCLVLSYAGWLDFKRVRTMISK